MWFKQAKTSFDFLLDRFSTELERQEFPDPTGNTCICKHGDFQHKWKVRIFFLQYGICRARCNCKKFKNAGKYTYSERVILGSDGLTSSGSKVRPSKELDIIIKKQHETQLW